MAGRCFTDTFIVRFPARHFTDDKCVSRSFEEAFPFKTRVLTRPQRSEEFQTGTGRDGILRNPGIPGFFGTGLTYFFHPGIDGIPGFFGTGLALYFYPGIFWKN